MTMCCAFRLFALASAALLLTSSAPVARAEYFPPPDSQGGWRELHDAKEIRRHWPFLRDRRIDAYAPITKRLLDE